MANYNTFSDLELISLLKDSAHDQKAFSEIYSRYVRVLIRFAESKLYTLEDARDVIHDLFTGLWDERSTLEIQESLKSYLFGIAKYKIINKIRKNIVRESYAEKLRTLSPAYHSLEEELNAKELRTNVRSKLDQLPQKTRYIYQSSRDEHKSIKEIAEELNLSDQTVKNQISIALNHLRKSLSAFFFCLF
ncbi:RNA polymerase sigma-70 factor [Pedobacter steynii]|uniref:RNA polymerase sigma-70 factor, ECF subfamily n=1 Tax=Pedobacter steynii TaxID=430522 RepID=A0A1D7QI98_9SPHI|nr:RNA polymerase sigma-70 factor [Pedobacter steynii]AOM78402.1 hypothetical protein BFS30_15180 [Pedobacter steynii]